MCVNFLGKKLFVGQTVSFGPFWNLFGELFLRNSGVPGGASFFWGGQELLDLDSSW